MVPISVIRSASGLFLTRLGKNWMWLYAGDRILHRYGFVSPLDSSVTPNSPLGDSTNCEVRPLSIGLPFPQVLKCSIVFSIDIVGFGFLTKPNHGFVLTRWFSPLPPTIVFVTISKLSNISCNLSKYRSRESPLTVTKLL